MNDYLWGALLGFFGVSITAVGAWLTGRRATKTQSEDRQAEHETASTVAAAKEWRTLYDVVNSDVESLKGRVSRIESLAFRMKRDLVDIWGWVDRGATPPPPVRPPYLDEPWEDTFGSSRDF